MKPSNAIRAVLFDLDGTLVDSARGIAATIDAVLVRHGSPAPDLGAVRALIGAPLEEIFAALVDGAGVATSGAGDQLVWVRAYADEYRSLYPALGIPNTPLFPGMADVLRACRDAGLRLAVVTTKHERVGRAVLAARGVEHLFDVLIGGDTTPHTKPHPAPADAALSALGCPPAAAAVVGDTGFDIGMARAAGCRAIGVGWGYQSATALVAAGADAIADRPGDLLALLLGPQSA